MWLNEFEELFGAFCILSFSLWFGYMQFVSTLAEPRK